MSFTVPFPLQPEFNLVDVPDKAAARSNLGVTAAIEAAANAAAAALTAGLATKQDTLVSGTNIRTVNGSSLLGSGDILIGASVAPLVLSTNLVEQRNGTAGQVARWYKTFTSATNSEAIEIDAAGSATTFDVAACIGSAGGLARGIRIGGKNAAGAFTPWLSFGTTGVATFNNANAGRTLAYDANGNLVNTSPEGTAGSLRMGAAYGRKGFYSNDALTFTCENFGMTFFQGSASQLLSLSATLATFIGDITLTPSASRTLTTNGQLTFERVSDTVCNLVYRGNDGVTRRSSLTFT